ncbi:transcription factor IIIC subunit delta N-term-domain-containing protein [Gigaspora margarita]|uniref:Transcription factor IIIC subunit delta N-term-domain-containing protein n=1 Tax=Gigaspora margarita TaxID=4874 RepID=A0A8H3X542_GIGMA|nr:transcription factor IIIC subunit delta N-term-domain-containing protein [Gigaspora margarita]
MELNNVDIKSRPININCLQWSEENHISVISPSGIDIFIPLYKSKYTRNAVVTCQDSSDRNPIKINDFNSTLIKDIPEVFKCLTWSPIGCSIIQSCLFIAITSRFHVAIYGPKDGPLQRDWIEVENMSPRLFQHYTEQTSENDADETLSDKLQSISVSWSPLCFPESFDPFSVIAVGSKAGTITLWSYKNGLDHILTMQPHVSWVITSSWSRWLDLGQDQYASSFVTASDDGSVYMWRVIISLIPVISSGIENIKIQASVTLHATLSQADNRPASIMKWYECNNTGEKLAIVKGLKIYIWASNGSPLINTDLDPPKMFKIPISRGIIAIIWNYDGSQLYIFNNEGNNLTINVSGTKIDVNESTTKYINDVLATKWQLQYEDNEDEDEYEEFDDESQNDDTLLSEVEPIYFGADGSGNSLFFAVLFALETTDALYITDKYEVSYVTFCPSEEQSNNELIPSLIMKLKDMLEDAYILERKSTNYLMWDLLEYCDLENESDKNDSLLHQMDKACWDCYHKYATSSSISGLTEFSLIGIIMKWKNVLYRNRSINALRLLMHIYSNTMHLEAPLDVQSQRNPAFEDCLKKIENYFLKQVLSTIVDCIKCGIAINNGHDQLFVVYWCDWILLYFNDDNELLKLAKFLYEYLSTLQELSGSFKTEKAWISQLLSSKKSKIINKAPTRASCPACQSNVSFMRGPTGQCTKGHIWDLCSITLNVVEDRNVRSCINCNRKILAFSDSRNPVGEQSVIVKAIFESCEKCFYCGGNFIFRQT